MTKLGIMVEIAPHDNIFDGLSVYCAPEGEVSLWIFGQNPAKFELSGQERMDLIHVLTTIEPVEGAMQETSERMTK